MSQTSTIGRYEVVNLLGEGAMGNVFKAQDPAIKRTVAIKTIKLDATRNEKDAKEFLERFRLEAQISGTLHHPNIVSIFDVGEENGTPYIAMEYVEGQTLSDLIYQDPRPTFPDLVQILFQIANALDFAHAKNVVHRDLKPSNIMVQDDGTAKIMDFGIAKHADSHLTQTGVFLGTPSYSSPEQVREGQVDSRSDTFSFAILTHEALTGYLPFPGKSISAILYKIANEDPTMAPNIHLLPIDGGLFRQLFQKALAKNPEERFQSSTEFIKALIGALRLSKTDQERVNAFSQMSGPVYTPTFGIQKSLQRSDFEIAQGAETLDKTVKIDGVTTNRNTRNRPRPSTPGQETHTAPANRGTLMTLFLLLVLIVLGGVAWKNGLFQTLFEEVPELETVKNLTKKTETTVPPETTETTPPPKREPVNVNLLIKTIPPGARTRMDGVEIGTTPFSFQMTAEPGSEKAFTFDLAGYKQRGVQITLAEDMEPQLEVALAAGTFTRAIVTKPAGATILVDGKTVGESPLDHPFVHGRRYRLRFQLADYHDRSFTYTEGKTDVSSLNYTLKKKPPPGEVRVKTLMEDLLLSSGETQTKGTKISLGEGQHQLTLRSKRYFYKQTMTVQVTAGKTQTVDTPVVITIPKIDFIGDYVKVKINGDFVKSNGKVDTTPLVNIKIAAGTHQFDFVDRNDKIVAQKTIEVKRSEAITVAAEQ
ncbi:serine/threonine protein kinase [Acanthopleuribacter pedis]|uniref:Serine/threonine protein kinase n=1 Tax=Acanthopleuribacter pedis TaxID=442870 RepID=A0A8J7U358_9BACT|nr:serine/threonine-protein kinase [Acanthopleuribacter pedis]MBO1316926.1 serine/threonine protein kinase [Acanthopleuribacter pedis]